MIWAFYCPLTRAISKRTTEEIDMMESNAAAQATRYNTQANTGAMLGKMPRPQSEIEREMTAVQDAIDELGAVINALSDRLSPVLAPRSAETAKGGGTAPGCGSPIAASLQKHSGTLRMHICTIQGLLDSLAV